MRKYFDAVVGGVLIAVNDTGVQSFHPDLLANLHPSLRYNAITGTNNANPSLFDPGGFHGTAVAGLISATANNGLGGTGVAPGAILAPVLMLGPAATFQTIARMGADAIYLMGFDGAADPRTRWAGTEHYRTTPTHPGLLAEWNRQIVASAKAALADRTVGAVGAAPTAGGSLLDAIGAQPNAIHPKRRALAHKFLLFMNRVCEDATCQVSP